MTEDMHEERLQAVEAFGDSFVRFRDLLYLSSIFARLFLLLCHIYIYIIRSFVHANLSQALQ